VGTLRLSLEVVSCGRALKKRPSMSFARSSRIWARIILCCLLGSPHGGCGGGGPTTEPGPLKDRDAIVKALPGGVTLESPVVPNPMYGKSSKTVEDALASLQAYVRDNVIYDGGLGSEIHFKQDGKITKDAKGTDKARKKGKLQASQTVIELAK
jgi:hypothetical protein